MPAPLLLSSVSRDSNILAPAPPAPSACPVGSAEHGPPPCSAQIPHFLCQHLKLDSDLPFVNCPWGYVRPPRRLRGRCEKGGTWKETCLSCLSFYHGNRLVGENRHQVPTTRQGSRAGTKACRDPLDLTLGASEAQRSQATSLRSHSWRGNPGSGS